MADRTESIVLDFEVDMEDSIQSIDNLTKANKALREERKKIDTQSVEGKKRIQEINTELDANTVKIKDNVSAIEKQKINVGNYRSALDGVHPALGKIGEGLESGTKGFKAMTLQALAFIATPIGLVIAAIGAALFALTAYFKGSEEGQNRLNKIMAVGSAIMEQFMNIVEAVGKAIFEAVSNPKQALIDFGNALKENLVNRFFGILELIPNIGKAIGLLFRGEFAEAGKVAYDAVAKVTFGVENASAKIAGLVESTAALVEQGISNGQKLADLNAKIVKDERALTEQRAANDLKVSQLRQKAVELEGASKKKVIEQAIALEEQLSKREVELARTRLALADLTIEANGDDIDALNDQATAQANLSAAEKSAFDNTLKFRKELKGLEKDINDALKEQIDLNDANRRAANQVADSGADPLIAAFQTQAEVRIDIEDRMQDDLKKRKDKAAREDRDRAEKGLVIQKAVEDQKLQAAAGVAAGIAGLLDQQSDAYKAFASAQVVISTYAAATKAYEAAFLPIPTVASPALGVAFAAAAVLQGIANLAKINGVEFAEGGWTGPGHKMKAVGVVHANEYVTPSWLVNSKQAQPHLLALEGMRHRGYVDGGLVSNSITQPINQQLELSNIFKNMPPMELSVKEVTKIQKRVKVKEQISKR